MRLDVYLTENKLAPSRARAVQLIKEGSVLVNGATADKPSFAVDGQKVEVIGQGLRYVSRGGLKLEAALDGFALSVSGLVCLDLGASTGGFTDCMLQRGAARVYAIDVGHGQLHEKLKNDPRVVNIEGCNVRQLQPDALPGQPGFAAADLSFISQRFLYAPLRGILPAGAPLVTLIKPQFEAGREYVGKKGVVKDREVHCRVLRSLREEAQKCGWILGALLPSPILGGDGNREYLALFGSETRPVSEEEIRIAVYRDA